MGEVGVNEARKKFAVYAISKHGVALARKLKLSLPECDIFITEKASEFAPSEWRVMNMSLKDQIAATFNNYECHVFFVSVGAVVRMISPLIQDKKEDPAVVCVDDKAGFAIAVLSGHVGNGNLFTTEIADLLQAEKVITTASDVQHTLQVDILGRHLGWKVEAAAERLKGAAMALVNEKRVAVVQECGEPSWWPLDEELPKGVDYFTSLDGEDFKDHHFVLLISDRDNIETICPRISAKVIIYRPQSLVIGIGCDRDIPLAALKQGIDRTMKAFQLAAGSIASIASIELKKDEPALCAYSHNEGLPFTVYGAALLDEVEGIENPSEVVKSRVGTRSVCEAAALLAAGATKLLVPKQMIYDEKSTKNLTLAIARAPFAERSPL